MEYFEKILSPELIGLIEQLIQKYHLEDYTKEPDPILKEAMLTSSLEEIGVFKAAHFNDEVKIYPYSEKLWDLLKELINKKIEPEALSGLISQELSIPQNISESMTAEIVSSDIVKGEIAAPLEVDTSEDEPAENSSDSKKGGLAQELM